MPPAIRLVPLGERHFRRAVAEHVAHYDKEWSHQERGNNLLRPACPARRHGPIPSAGATRRAAQLLRTSGLNRRPINGTLRGQGAQRPV